jgi:phosphoserine phosphatase RsbU/P
MQIMQSIMTPAGEYASAYVQSLEQDLLLASEVQSRLLPIGGRLDARVDLGAHYTPARLIGGDFYDFVRYPGKAISAGALADVCGKGAAAAIYAALVTGLLRSLETRELCPAELLTALNASLHSRPVAGQFVSLLYTTWNEHTRRFQIANSGLPYPIWVRNGRILPVEIGGVPLGLFSNTRYDEVVLECRPGDLVLLFTDGVTDATNARGQEFGRTRLEDIACEVGHLDAQKVVHHIFNAIERHAGQTEIFDDQTVIAIRT